MSIEKTTEKPDIEKITEKASNVTINILTVIDTDYVRTKYPNPSQNPNNPTGIDHTSQYLICTGARKIISGQGTADLNFTAYINDNVSFRGVSVYGNSDDAVIIYAITGSPNVFNKFQCNVINIPNAVMPDNASNNGLPALLKPISFASFDSKVASSGKELFVISFALYKMVNGNTQQLVGYYAWDPTITVP